MSLGSLGTPHDDVEPETFDYFGSTIRTNPELTEMALAEFFERAGSVDMDDKDSVLAASGALMALLRDAIHPEEFGAFWATAKRNRQTAEDLLVVANAIIEGVVGRPTSRPSGSTGRPGDTSQKSASGVIEAAHPGRPDLQSAALRIVEERAG